MDKLLGQRIREQRMAQGMSIEALAEAVSIVPHFLGDIERGLKSPSLDTFIRIVNALNVPADLFVRDKCIPSALVVANDFGEKLMALTPRQRLAAEEIMTAVLENVKNLK